MKKILARFLKPRAQLYAAINSAPAITGCITAINVAFDPKQEWSTLKYGVYPNAVGLQVFDRPAAEAMVQAFNNKLSQLADGFRGLPGYIGHPDDAGWARQNPGARAEAIARIKEMRVTAEGLQFRTAFNDQGTRLVTGDAPAYEAYSPNWGMVPITYQGRKAFRPVEMYSIGFTNQPNIPGSIIGLNEALPPEQKTSNPMNPDLIKLLAALGITVAADADEATLTKALADGLAAINKMMADATAAKGEVSAANEARTTAVNEAATMRTQLATERSARAGLLITSAINEGRLTEAGRAEWLGKFTAEKADFTAVAADLGKLTKAVNTQAQAQVGARRGEPANKKKITAINEAIVAKCQAMGTHDRNAAYLALKAEGHELFKNEVAAE